MDSSSRRRLLALLALILAVLLGADRPAFAVHPGAVDQSFGDGGELLLGFDGQSFAPTAFALRPDGTLLVIGTTGTGETGATAELVLMQRRPDGTPDPGFGTAGVVRTTLPRPLTVGAVALEPSGGILLAGSVRTGPSILEPDGAHRAPAVRRKPRSRFRRRWHDDGGHGGRCARELRGDRTGGRRLDRRRRSGHRRGRQSQPQARDVARDARAPDAGRRPRSELHARWPWLPHGDVRGRGHPVGRRHAGVGRGLLRGGWRPCPDRSPLAVRTGDPGSRWTDLLRPALERARDRCRDARCPSTARS